MNVSTKSEYGLRALIYLAGHEDRISVDREHQRGEGEVPLVIEPRGVVDALGARQQARRAAGVGQRRPHRVGAGGVLLGCELGGVGIALGEIGDRRLGKEAGHDCQQSTFRIGAAPRGGAPKIRAEIARLPHPRELTVPLLRGGWADAHAQSAGEGQGNFRQGAA